MTILTGLLLLAALFAILLYVLSPSRPWLAVQFCFTIEVRDKGTGISAGDLPKIFIPFFTTKPNGHGIGLALAHRIVTEHGGTLTAANSPTGGAVFTIKPP